MIDTHCHLEMKAFESDIDDVIERAKAAGVEAAITIGSDSAGSAGAVALSDKYDFIFAAVGMHPHDAKDFNSAFFERMKKWVSRGSGCGFENGDGERQLRPKVVGIGEIGLDYHYDLSPRDKQKEVFEIQLQYAREIDLPVVVHSRDAAEDTLAILKGSGVYKGVMHCFSGDLKMAKAALDIGFHISIAGPVTFKKESELVDVARYVPDERLLIETDAPYLAPVPYRGKRNEPAFIIETAKCVARLRGVTLEDIDRITSLNAKRLFGIGEPDGGKIAYEIRDSLYLNITNRCTNKCRFCIKYHSDFVKGHNLRLESEPDEEELKQAIGDPSAHKEIVFCGYGEPTLRLDVVKSVASWVKRNGGKVRINTNGHGNLINKRNILPELKGLVDSISVSLDAQDEETYNKICRPAFKGAFGAVLDFIKEAKIYAPEVRATIVEMEGVDVDKCRRLCDSLGVKLHVRKLDIVG